MGKSMETENRLVVAWSWREVDLVGKWGITNGGQICGEEDENVLKLEATMDVELCDYAENQ